MLLSLLHKNAHSNTLGDKLSNNCTFCTQERKIYGSAQNKDILLINFRYSTLITQVFS